MNHPKYDFAGLPQLECLIFDLDGTLADTALDFAELRLRLGIGSKTAPILETVATWPEPRQRWAHSIIHEFELEGAERAKAYEGVHEFLEQALTAKLKLGLFTRNSRVVTERILRSLKIPIQHVITRDDARPKPHPEGLLALIERTRSQRESTVFIGDYLYDLEAGAAAEVGTGLFLSSPIDVHAAPMGARSAQALIDSALFSVSHFKQLELSLRHHFHFEAFR